MMNNKKLTTLIFSLFLLLPVCLSAQTASQRTAAELETVLAAPQVTNAQAARFVYASAGKDSIEIDRPNDPITLRELSHLIMQAFEIKGGMMYSFFPSPRYAYRTMLSRSYIQGTSDPSMTVSGERFLLILGRVLNAQGDNL